MGDANTQVEDDGEADLKPYSLVEFDAMITETERILQNSIKQIENGGLVKKGNNFGSSNNRQKMYGRIRCPATEEVLNILELKPNDTFMDIGHGLGIPSIQAAFTRGCEARGIEILDDRHGVALILQEEIEQLNEKVIEQHVSNLPQHLVGKIDLRLGDFRLKKNRKFVIECNKILVNNAHDIFGARSGDGNREPLNSFVGALFAEMRPGSIMVTLDKITCLGRSVSEENQNRVRRELEPHPNASFFEYERRSIGNCAVTWGGDLKEQFVWVYRRIHDGTETNIGKFICSHPHCESGNTLFTNIIPSRGDEDYDHDVEKSGFITLLREHCIYCNEKRMMSVRGSRRGWKGPEPDDPTRKKKKKKSQSKQIRIENRRFSGEKLQKRGDIHDILHKKAYAKASLEIDNDDAESDFSIEVYDVQPSESKLLEVSKIRKSEGKYNQSRKSGGLKDHKVKETCSKNKRERRGLNGGIVQQKEFEERRPRLEFETPKVLQMSETPRSSKCKSVSSIGSPRSTPNIESSSSSEVSAIVGRNKRVREETNVTATRTLHIYQHPFIGRQCEDVVTNMSLHDTQKADSIKAGFAVLKTRRRAHPIYGARKKQGHLHASRNKRPPPQPEVIEIIDSDDDE